MPGFVATLWASADDGVGAHLDLGTFVFTREPYSPDSPPAGRPHEDGWQPT